MLSLHIDGDAVAGADAPALRFRRGLLFLSAVRLALLPVFALTARLALALALRARCGA